MKLLAFLAVFSSLYYLSCCGVIGGGGGGGGGHISTPDQGSVSNISADDDNTNNYLPSFWGRCPHKSVPRSFNLVSFLGGWYVHSTKSFIPMLSRLRCLTVKYYLESQNVVQVYHSAVLPLLYLQVETRGEGKVIETSARSKATWQLKNTFPIIGSIETPYWILSTDYKNFAVIWICVEYAWFNAETVFVLTRKPILDTSDPKDENIIKRVRSALDKNGFNQRSFQPVVHAGCEYYSRCP